MTPGSPGMAGEPSSHDDFPTFKAGAPWWGGHLQTLAGALPATRRQSLDRYSSERLVTSIPDGTGDRLVATLHRPMTSDKNRCPVILIHGVSGTEDSSYILRSAAYFLNLGYPVLRANLRGAGPSRALCKLQYNAGTSNDLVHLASMLPDDLRSRGIAAIGYSLGGNVLMKFLGERGSSSPIKIAVAVSSPLNLAPVSQRLMQWDNALFQYVILSQLKQESIKPAAELSEKERSVVLNARNVLDFDDSFTAPRNGFSSAQDYYTRSSCQQFLKNVAVPTLMIYASDDPLVPRADYDQYDWDKNPNITRLISRSGGHVGFRQTSGHAYWNDVCAARFLEKIGAI